MPPPCTVDASVFLNALARSEAGHAASERLLAHLEAEAAPIVAPTLLITEIAAAIGRGQQDPVFALETAQDVSRLKHLTLISLDSRLAEEAASIAATQRLRGSDAVYAAVALRFNATLVTRDREQRERLGAVLDARYPEEALATL
jgi:predicted nucleic acid-binding protein